MRHVLLIDDDLAMRNLSKYVLKTSQQELTITEAVNGEEGLQLLQDMDIKPDVIFLDLEMPRMNGLEFLAAYKKQSSALKATAVCILTTIVDGPILEKIGEAGVVCRVFEKPLTQEHIDLVLPGASEH
jgi:CheY-like chemotaxis protein